MLSKGEPRSFSFYFRVDLRLVYGLIEWFEGTFLYFRFKKMFVIKIKEIGSEIIKKKKKYVLGMMADP